MIEKVGGRIEIGDPIARLHKPFYRMNGLKLKIPTNNLQLYTHLKAALTPINFQLVLFFKLTSLGSHTQSLQNKADSVSNVAPPTKDPSHHPPIGHPVAKWEKTPNRTDGKSPL